MGALRHQQHLVRRYVPDGIDHCIDLFEVAFGSENELELERVVSDPLSHDVWSPPGGFVPGDPSWVEGTRCGCRVGRFGTY